jgi:hypothetical protein
MLRVDRRISESTDRVLLVATDGDREIGYAWVLPLVTSSKTGQDVGPMAELEYIEVFEECRPRAAALRMLFCESLWFVMSLDAGSEVRGMVMEAANESVQRALDRIPEIVTLTEYPFYKLLSADDFPVVDRRFCDRLRTHDHRG